MFTDRIHHPSLDEPRLVARVAAYGIATLVLTLVHHAYGAVAFATPWRLHVAFVSIPVAAAIAVADIRYRREPRGTSGAIAVWTIVVLTLVVSVLFFGVFEGAYNHVLKDAFYGAGAPPRLLHQLFPPPTYEPPTDLFFEITGVLHVVPAALAARALWRLFGARRVTALSPGC